MKCFLGRENVWGSREGSALCWSHKEACCVWCENTGCLLASLPLACVYLKLPPPLEGVWGVCVYTRAQDVRQEGQGAGRSLPAGPPSSRAQASGPGNQGVRPGQWEALGKSCHCVFGNPVITVLAAVISVSIAIAHGKSVPTCVFYRDLFSKNVLDSQAAWLTLQRNLGVRRGWSPWGSSGDG